MFRAEETALIGVCLLTAIPGARAAEDTGVIVASIVVGLLFLILVVGITIYCFYKKSTPEPKEKRKPRKHLKHYPATNGYYPNYPNPQHVKYPKPQHANGYAKQNIPVRMDPPPVRPAPMYSYATYSGPPPELHHYPEMRHGTVSGPPPVAVIPTQFGSVAIRPDPRPVVHSRKYKKHHSPKREEGRHRSPSRSRKEPQEYIVQPSYDGIPIVRPVIYVDDDDKDRRSRSKSRDRKSHNKESSSSEQKVIEIRAENMGKGKIHRPGVPDPEPEPRISDPEPRPVTPTPTPQPRVTPVRSPVRSRASSVTEAMNVLRQSVEGHLDDDDEDDTASESSRHQRWQTEDLRKSSKVQAPDPVAGDVLFYPAGQPIDTGRHIPSSSIKDAEYGYSTSIRKSSKEEPEIPPRAPVTKDYSSTWDDLANSRKSEATEPEENVYSYSKVIRTTTVQKDDNRLGWTTTDHSRANQGYEVPSQLSKTLPGTRDENVRYETEHGQRPISTNTDMRASMSDRLTSLVEDGDKTRFSHYNIGAMNLGPEEEDEPVQMRHTRPRTPPKDIPRDSREFSYSTRRPATPPNDIPLITPRESTEIPPLNLQSPVTSPRDFRSSYRPATPPQDFPMTPTASSIHPRPSTPPFDAETARSAAQSARPMTQTIKPAASQLSDTARSVAVDPSTGEPGSFQARQRLIEAHLKNVAGSPPSDKTASVPKQNTKPEAPRPELPARDYVDSAPTVSYPPGVIPPAPPPPPPPPPPPVPK